MEQDIQKTIGLIGGMSWESTVPYYQIINEVISQKLGGFHSAKIILYSVDFAEVELCQSEGRWEDAGNLLGSIAKRLQLAGADFVVLCTNTMHKVSSQIVEHIDIPLLHIAEVTAQELNRHGICKVGLLGTKYTLQQDFYKEKLAEKGIEAIVPGEADIEIVNRVIYDELCKGKICPESKQEFLRIIENLQVSGAEGIVLGCTEIGLLIKQTDVSIPVFDTTDLHAKAAALKALGM